jgi:hypothetical protein
MINQFTIEMEHIYVMFLWSLTCFFCLLAVNERAHYQTDGFSDYGRENTGKMQLSCRSYLKNMTQYTNLSPAHHVHYKENCRIFMKFACCVSYT